MQVCDYCGEDIVTIPYRRRGRSYCSRTCAEEHEFKAPDSDEEIDDENIPEEEQGSFQ